MTDRERFDKMKALIYLERAMALDGKYFFLQLVDDETVKVTDSESGNSLLVNVACDNLPAMLLDFSSKPGHGLCKGEHDMKAIANIEPTRYSISLLNDDGQKLYTWHTRLIQDSDGVESYKIVRKETRSYEDVLLDYGIDDEDLILSLEALESSANDAMEALFLQTGGGY